MYLVKDKFKTIKEKFFSQRSDPDPVQYSYCGFVIRPSRNKTDFAYRISCTQTLNLKKLFQFRLSTVPVRDISEIFFLFYIDFFVENPLKNCKSYF
jgi:hypothetical protein